MDVYPKMGEGGESVGTGIAAYVLGVGGGHGCHSKQPNGGCAARETASGCAKTYARCGGNGGNFPSTA
jgi:hypothetical protein